MILRRNTILRGRSLMFILPLTAQDNLACRDNMHVYAANSRHLRLCEGLLAICSFNDMAHLIDHICKDANWAKILEACHGVCSCQHLKGHSTGASTCRQSTFGPYIMVIIYNR